jgi:predicted PurR-regulated permease PerM
LYFFPVYRLPSTVYIEFDEDTEIRSMTLSQLDSNPWPPRRVALATLVVASVAGAFLLLYVFRTVLFLLLIGIVLAMALNPVVQLLQGRGISRATASVIVYLTLGCLLLAGALVGLPLVWQQTESLLGTLPHSYQQLREYLIGVPSELVSRFAERLPRRLFNQGGSQPRAEDTINAVAQAFGYGGLVLRVVYLVVAIVLLAFYWSVYEDRTVRSLLLLAPQSRRDDVRDLADQIEAKVGAYLRAQGLLCLMMGGLVLVAYWLIGVPYVLALAVVAGVLEAVPVFGPVLGAIPALLVALSVSSSTAAWVLGAVVVIQQFESNVLVPRLMDRSVGVNAIVTLLAIAGFSALLGLAGAVLAIPMAAVIQLLLDRWVFRPQAPDDFEPVGRGAASLLQYQLRELLGDVQVKIRGKETLVTERSDRLEEAIESLARDLDRALMVASVEAASVESVSTATESTA